MSSTALEKKQTMTEIERRDRYEPQDFTQLKNYCKTLVKSQLCPDKVNRWQDAMIICQQGAEIGLSTMQSLKQIHVIKGETAMSSDLIVGLVKKSDLCEYFYRDDEASTKRKAVYVTKRKGTPKEESYSFSWSDAETANLTWKDNWKNNPQQMCEARSSAFLARDVYPDIVGGLYTPEEIQSGNIEGSIEENTKVSDPKVDSSNVNDRAQKWSDDETESEDVQDAEFEPVDDEVDSESSPSDSTEDEDEEHQERAGSDEPKSPKSNNSDGESGEITSPGMISELCQGTDIDAKNLRDAAAISIVDKRWGYLNDTDQQKIASRLVDYQSAAAAGEKVYRACMDKILDSLGFSVEEWMSAQDAEATVSGLQEQTRDLIANYY